MDVKDPIAAVSTPYGKGGIAVIRMSGDGVIAIADRFFKRHSGRSLGECRSSTCTYGQILYDGEVIDDGIATVFHAPHSFTGEDTVEINCHGGIVLTESVLTAALSSGCRMAEAGEFTKRAFMNGKIGLSQAEAVIDLIDAESLEKCRLSAAQSEGVLARAIASAREKITAVLASVYAYIDYPDEDLTDMSVGELSDRIAEISADLSRLSDTYRAGHAICEGIPTVIVGKPNTGKSSLLNAILGKNRAIVTDIAGTTRDTIEETVTVGRVTLRLADTAGIRETEDTVEKIGVQASLQKIDEAELILAVFDGAAPLDDEDVRLIRHLRDVQNKAIIPIVNKSDMPGYQVDPQMILLGEPIAVSASQKNGLECLYSRISDLFVSERIDYQHTAIITNARQNAAISRALEHIRSAADALSCGFSQDVAGFDLENALSSLGEIDGRSVSQDITDTIFHRFCVGK